MVNETRLACEVMLSSMLDTCGIKSVAVKLRDKEHRYTGVALMQEERCQQDVQNNINVPLLVHVYTPQRFKLICRHFGKAASCVSSQRARWVTTTSNFVRMEFAPVCPCRFLRHSPSADDLQCK